MPKDAQLITTKALPAAGANNDHDGIDIGARTSPKGVIPGDVEVEIAWEALPSLVEAKTVTFTLQDSANDSAYTSLGITHVITGGTGGGLAAGTKRFRLPATVRRYIRVNQAVESGGGTNTDKYTTVSVVTGES